MRPRASIAIPTYQRRDKLRRAVESALAQTIEDIEVVVSDNASRDGTHEMLRALAGADDRLRVVRQPENRGMVANLDAALRLAEGEHVMLLSDDDWLDPRCLEASLEAAGANSSAIGQVAYEDGTGSHPGGVVGITADDPRERVRTYLAAVDGDRGNTWFYALTPRRLLDGLPAIRNVLGFDWLRVAELAFRAPIAHASETLIFRELGGTSETTERNVRESGLPLAHARMPHLVIAAEVLADVGWRSPAYSPLNRAQRLRLATECAAGIPRRNARHVAFHLAPAALRSRWRSR